MKNFILIFLFTLAGYIVGEFIYLGLFENRILLFILIFLSLVLFSDKFNKDEYTYWLITVQKPSKTGGKITITSARKIKNNFFNNKDIDEYYNNLCSETGEWNILFYSKLSKKEYNLYFYNNNKNE